MRGTEPCVLTRAPVPPPPPRRTTTPPDADARSLLPVAVEPTLAAVDMLDARVDAALALALALTLTLVDEAYVEATIRGATDTRGCGCGCCCAVLLGARG